MCHSWKSLETLWYKHHTPSGTVTLGRGGCQSEFLKLLAGEVLQSPGAPHPQGSKGLII